MWSRAQLKANAKQVLKRTYWTGFLVMILMGVLTAGQGGSGLLLRLQSDFGLNVAYGTIASIGAFSLIYSIFLSNPLVVGKNYYFLRSREYDPEVSNIFSRFGNGNYKNVVVTMLLVNVKVFLWSLLFIIPGIIKSYEYRFVSYIIAENPSISYQRAFEISKDMTDGIKFQIFLMELSFLGWYILGTLLLGVGVFFVNPYFEAAFAELYMAQRAKVLSMYRASGEELCGFEN